MIKLKDIINEGNEFENLASFLLNPQYNDKSFEELVKDFKTHGGKLEGEASYGMVFSHPAWKYVIKIFADDEPYLQYIRFCLQHPLPSFPKLFDKPRRIVPNFKRTKQWEHLYVVKMEKLFHITKQEFEEIEFYLLYGDSDFVNAPDNEVWKQTKRQVEMSDRKFPKLKRFSQDYQFLLDNASQRIKGSLDITENNIMKRADGDFVLSDPFWVGRTIYAQHDRLQKIEMDFYGNDEEKPAEPQIMGGKKHKKEKPVKPIPTPQNKNHDDVPF